jgi:tryptophan-rich sensory protein
MAGRSNLTSLARLIVSLEVCIAIGCSNVFFARSLSPTWFAKLELPVFLPPYQYLIPVTLFIYLILGFVLYLIWQVVSRTDLRDKMRCIVLLCFTLTLMGMWAYLFFDFESPFMGVMIGALVVAMLMATMVQAVRVSFGAAILLFPAVILVFFAAYANYLIVLLNPSLPIIGV